MLINVYKILKVCTYIYKTQRFTQYQILSYLKKVIPRRRHDGWSQGLLPLWVEALLRQQKAEAPLQEPRHYQREPQHQ